MIQLSTGLRAALIGPQSLDLLLRDAVIHCYSGSQAANADLPAPGTLLGKITANGGPFTPGSPTNGLRFIRSGIYLLKDPNQVWRFEGDATGVLGHFRVFANAPDDNAASPIAMRMDGAIGLSDSVGDIQMRFAALEVSASTSVDVSGFIFAFPPLPSA